MNPQMDETSITKTEQLAACFRKLAEVENCEFLDAGQHVSSSKVDGVHLDESEQHKIGAAIAATVKNIFASKVTQKSSTCSAEKSNFS